MELNNNQKDTSKSDPDEKVENKEVEKLVEGLLTLEQVFDKYVGSFGSFQIRLTLFIIILAGPVTSMNMITQFLIFLTPPHRCQLPDTDVTANDLNSTSIIGLDNATFLVHDGGCRVKPLANNLTDSTSFDCPNGYDYDHDLIYPTLISENDWVCDDRWKSLLPHSVFWCGAFIGCFVFGALSDCFGRVRTTMIIFSSAGLSGLAGLLLTDYYPLFVVSRGLMGFSFTGSVTLVLAIEFVGVDKRLLVSTGFVVSHSLTSAAWSSLAYVIGNWRIILALTSGLQLVIPLICLFIPESARWLYSKGRSKQGADVIRKVSAINGREVPDDVIDSIVFKKPTSLTFRDFIRFKRLTSNFIIVGLVSILNGIVYIGANLYGALLVKNPFRVLTINGSIDFLAGLISKSLADRYGRKKTLILNLFITFALYESTYFIAQSSVFFMIAFYLARMCVSMVFNILYLFAAEIVPTSFRSRAVSTRLCLNNFGAFIAPLVIASHSFSEILPLILFGLTALIAGILSLFLPETLGVPLPETCEQANALR